MSEPDPFLLLKGLNRIVKKPLEMNRDPSFRISLARSTLQVDATPTSTSITQFLLHLQAELEQVAHLEGGGPRRREAQKEERQREMTGLKTAKIRRMTDEEWKARREGRVNKEGDREETRERSSLP